MSDGLREAAEVAFWREREAGCVEADRGGYAYRGFIDGYLTARADHSATPTEKPKWLAFPGKAPVCRECGADWEPVRRGECIKCGGDAGPLKPAEVAVEEREALAELLMSATNGEHGFGYHDCESTSDRREGCGIVADALMPHIAALTAKARAEGRVEALREAADVVAGWDEAISRDAPHFAGWLHDRANEEAP